MNKLIRTYLGFSIKSRSVVIGQDRLKATKEKVKLIMYCSSASNNLKDLALRLSERFKCHYVCVDNLQDYMGIEGCKIVGLTNISLAGAVLNEAKKDNEVKVGGNYGE